MLKSFFTDTEPSLEIIDADADNETLYGTGVDMGGYIGVVFYAAALKGEAGTFTLKAQQDTVSNFATAADLEGTATSIVTATATHGFGFIEVKNPRERYVRPALVCPNLVAVKSIAIISVRYGKKYLPETNADGELHVNPAEGTA